ncbi:hypothetical protein PoMZ_09374 [Pyricularia oryzae]|uniref:Uncharacterized protein n=1 Tax=Pyricularia oryzae TaxID=318829 RepID=A0A4V1C4Q3_PYROR|nr:hypothetical protein PoMZ_09374 [Pyricularia oryzae]
MAGNVTHYREERSSPFERAFPSANWEAAEAECMSLPTLKYRVDFLTRNFPGIVRIACLPKDEPIQSHVRRVRKAFAKIISHPQNFDKTGADLGLTGVPPILLDGFLTRYGVNSSDITMGELNDISGKPEKHGSAVCGGATVYYLTWMMPSRDGDVAAMHIDNLVVPDDDRDSVFVTSTSVAYPEEAFPEERKHIMAELKVTQLGVAASGAAEHEETLSKLLLADDGRVWGTDLVTALLEKDQICYSSPELISQSRAEGLKQISNEAQFYPIFQLRMAHAIKINQAEHRALRTLKHLNSVSTSRGQILTVGRGTPENSCAAHCFYDIASVKQGFFAPEHVFSNTLDSLLFEVNRRADAIYIAKNPGPHLRTIYFLDEERRSEDYKIVPKEIGETFIKKAFESKSLFNVYARGANQWTTHAEKLPQEVSRFFVLVMDIFAQYVEDWASSLP